MPNFLIIKQLPTDIDKERKLELLDTKEKINNHVLKVSKSPSVLKEIEESLDEPEENETEEEYVSRMKKKIINVLMKKVGF